MLPNIHLRSWFGLCLTVQDDGQGFHTDAAMLLSDKPAGLGLTGMRERFELLGGQLKIESNPGKGTRLVVSVPLSEAR